MEPKKKSSTKKKSSMDVAESDLADTWSSPKSQHLRATRTRWVNNLRQPEEKAVLKNGGDEDDQGVGLPWVTKSVIHHLTDGVVIPILNGVLPVMKTLGVMHAITHHSIPTETDVGSYARSNAPFNTFADEDVGGYARNNAPFNPC